MMKRLPLFGGLTVLALTIALTGCDPNKNGAPTAAPSAGPGTASESGTTAPAVNKNSSAAFNTPRKATGDILIRVITNGSDPFWDSMGIGLADGLKTVKADPGSKWLPPQGTDNNSQKTVFEQQLAANADGIAVSTIQADAFKPVIDAAIDKGIPARK